MKPEKKTTRKKVNLEQDSPFQPKKRPSSPAKGRAVEEEKSPKSDGRTSDSVTRRPRKRKESDESESLGPEKVFVMRRPLSPEERKKMSNRREKPEGKSSGERRRTFSGTKDSESRRFSKGGFNRAPRKEGENDRRGGTGREKRPFGGSESTPRRESSTRKPRREGEERSFKREDAERTPRRESGDWPFRREGGERTPRRESGARISRREGGRTSAFTRRESGGGNTNDDRMERKSKPFTRENEREDSPFSKYQNRDAKRDRPKKEKKNPLTKHEKPAPQNSPFTEGIPIRLNRYLSVAGISSRREADEIIRSGRVTVNGEIVTEMGHKVTPGKDIVTFNKEEIQPRKLIYILLNKPKNTITTTEDPEGRLTVMDLIKDATRERVFPVGRLDRNTTGLLLLTNDGELAEKLTHPSHGIRKIYKVTVNKDVDEADIEKLKEGFDLDDGFIKADKAGYLDDGFANELGIEIHSGRNRVVRRMLAHLGYEVRSLDRVMFGPLTKKKLKRGWWRFLSPEEIGWLKML